MTNELGTTLQDIQAKAERKREVLEAFERVKSNASYGISSGDYEIMNRGGYNKDMLKHRKDAETIRKYIEEN